MLATRTWLGQFPQSLLQRQALGLVISGAPAACPLPLGAMSRIDALRRLSARLAALAELEESIAQDVSSVLSGTTQLAPPSPPQPLLSPLRLSPRLPLRCAKQWRQLWSGQQSLRLPPEALARGPALQRHCPSVLLDAVTVLPPCAALSLSIGLGWSRA